jgi:thiamine biosynthesis lipoprotein
MRFASATCAAIVATAVLTAAQSPAPIHRQRFAMWTVVDVLAYHPSRTDAEAAIAKALEEVERLDGVLSNYEADSDISKLVRDARHKAVAVDSSLFDVIQRSVDLSKRSGGKFDVTIGPLLSVWKKAKEEDRKPTPEEIAAARKCVGYEKIESTPPDRILIHSDCVEIDVGGIGKGYAVERAMSILRASGIRNALINAGSSAIAAIGTPPDGKGWPVRLIEGGSGSRSLLLKDTSIATSEQTGSIIDPLTGNPTSERMTVSVIAPSATLSDGLSTTLLLMSIDEGKKLLEHYEDVSAFWIAPGGQLKASYGESRVSFVESAAQR